MKTLHTMNRHRTEAGRSQTAWSSLFAFTLAILVCATAWAQAPAASGGAAPAYTAEELDKLVGPIALYPDDLVAIILPSSTNPLQIVQAERFLEKRKADPKAPIDEKWDDPVKSLLNYPDVVKKMSADLDWTAALGEAVVSDQGAVIEAVQVFRRKAKAAGNLKSDDKQVVKTEQEIVIIEPADPQVIYVPQYNPTTVVVQSAAPVYAYYPTPYPSYYYPYPPGAALATGVIWGAAIGAAWSGNRYGCCDDVNVNVNKSTNVDRSSSRTQTGGRQQASGSSAWKSDKKPGQVSNSVGKSASTARAGDARGGAGGAGAGRAGPSTQPAGGAGAGRASPSTQPAGGAGAAGGGEGRGGASAQPTGGGRGGGGGDAFGGYSSGRQAQADRSRGASSRGASSSGARGGGGGGGGRGGGGGGGGRGGGGRR
jgi:hypothetical protein